MRKKKTLEDVIPGNILKFHLFLYQVLKQIEEKNLSDFDTAIAKFTKIDDIIHSFVKDKWIDEETSQDLMHDFRGRLEEVVFKDYDLDKWLFMKSELETVKVTYKFKNKGFEKIVKRRGKGRGHFSLARSYLLASLCGEIKEREIKPCYEIIAGYFQDVLEEKGFNSRRIETENKRIRKSGIMLHILDVLSTYMPEKLK